MHKLFTGAAVCAACTFASAQNAPCRGTALIGAVHDSTQALIPGATLTLDATKASTQTATTGPDGRFRMPCLPDGPHQISVSAPGFATLLLQLPKAPTLPLDLTLQPEAVQTDIDVSADTDAPPSATSTGPSQTISGAELQQLADDPDDLLRELQQLAALTGGSPANTTISVDGFQGSSNLPPKASIAYIKVNPDQFSAEYREPPFEGGRVEVYTKPGQKVFHGALFTTNGSPFENAKDPFSTSKAAIGKQRYGFELSGPVRPHVRQGAGSDFALALEHRSINNFAVVDAVILDPSGNQVQTSANVATPQRLWIGTARVDWQLGPKNTFIASYSANVNSLLNVGVGGTSLAETGYNASRYEHIFRVSDITTASAHLMHEARLSLRFDGEDDAPLSTAPQLQVAGAFTGGGALGGAAQTHELNVEFDDDAILTTKAHTLKFGAFLLAYIDHRQIPSDFSGSYVFGGGTAPVLNAANQPTGQTALISGLEQYRRALAGLPGGTPTVFSSVTGTPTVDFTTQKHAFFVQDDWNVGHRVHIAYGLRYFFEVNPTTLDGATPRLGILWSPDKKGAWTLHAHVGLFTGQFPSGNTAEILREDGRSRITSTVYNPTYGNPAQNATPIYSQRAYSPHIAETLWSAENIGGTHAFPHGWNLSADFFLGRLWNDARTLNINSPTNGVPTGPRPLTPNLDLLQTQNSGQGNVDATFIGVEQHTLKHVQFFFGGVRVQIVDDTDDSALASPQSAYTNAGEFAHRTNQPVWNVFGNGTLTLPRKLQLSTDVNAGGDAHYNLTTGSDNNGDGNFNDRPQYAAPGTPGAIQTPYGLLIAAPIGTPGTGIFPRNKGVLPWTFHVDTNLQRAFPLTRNRKADHQQTLTLNVRSSNVLNHLNVTGVGGVLGSPLFGVPFSADNGRRIEAGARYSF